MSGFTGLQGVNYEDESSWICWQVSICRTGHLPLSVSELQES